MYRMFDCRSTRHFNCGEEVIPLVADRGFGGDDGDTDQHDVFFHAGNKRFFKEPELAGFSLGTDTNVYRDDRLYQRDCFDQGRIRPEMDNVGENYGFVGGRAGRGVRIMLWAVANHGSLI